MRRLGFLSNVREEGIGRKRTAVVLTVFKQCSNSVLTPLWQEVFERSNTSILVLTPLSIQGLAF